MSQRRAVVSVACTLGVLLALGLLAGCGKGPQVIEATPGPTETALALWAQGKATFENPFAAPSATPTDTPTEVPTAVPAPTVVGLGPVADTLEKTRQRMQAVKSFRFQQRTFLAAGGVADLGVGTSDEGALELPDRIMVRSRIFDQTVEMLQVAGRTYRRGPDGNFAPAPVDPLRPVIVDAATFARNTVGLLWAFIAEPSVVPDNTPDTIHLRGPIDAQAYLKDVRSGGPLQSVKTQGTSGAVLDVFINPKDNTLRQTVLTFNPPGEGAAAPGGAPTLPVVVQTTSFSDFDVPMAIQEPAPTPAPTPVPPPATAPPPARPAPPPAPAPPPPMMPTGPSTIFVTATPVPTATPLPTSTPRPTATNTPTSTPVPAAVQVDITNSGFSPPTVVVALGGRVTWVNRGSGPQTVTDDSGVPNSNAISPGGAWTYTFTVAGTATYHSEINKAFTGTVVVVAPGASTQANGAPLPTLPPAQSTPANPAVIPPAPTFTGPPPAPSVLVDINDQGYVQANVTVLAGGKVTWTNRGNQVHTVTADDFGYDSGGIGPNQSYSHVYPFVGTYPIHSESDFIQNFDTTLNQGFRVFTYHGTVTVVSSAVISLNDNTGFSPQNVAVAQGGWVTFVNKGRQVHTATFEDGSYDTGPMGPGMMKEIQAINAGTFAFKSKNDPNWPRGVLVVSVPPPTPTIIATPTAAATPTFTAIPTSTPTPATTPGPPVVTFTVNVDDYQGYTPSTVVMPAGSIVMWLNKGNLVHTATMDDGSFDSGGLASGQAAFFQINLPGVYSFHSETDRNPQIDPATGQLLRTSYHGQVVVGPALPAPTWTPIPTPTVMPTPPPAPPTTPTPNPVVGTPVSAH